MKKYIILILVVKLLLCQNVYPNGQIFYVSPSGNDSNCPTCGQIDKPFATMDFADSVVSPGDIVYLREGVYTEIVSINTSGTSSDRIIWMGYSNEDVVINGLEYDDSIVSNMVEINANYITFKNINIKNTPRVGLRVNGDYFIGQNLLVKGCGYHGIKAGQSSEKGQFTNCVSEYNYNYCQFNTTQNNARGDHADGFVIIGQEYVIENCIARFNSDDGFDSWSGFNISYANCVAYSNGFEIFNERVIQYGVCVAEGFGGDGGGFKMGGASFDDLCKDCYGDHCIDRDQYNSYYRCLAYDNAEIGFSTNSASKCKIYNCTSYNQKSNFLNHSRSYGCEWVNNVSYNPIYWDFNTSGVVDLTEINNSWNPFNPTIVSVDISDFISVVRPDNDISIDAFFNSDFLQLANTSNLVDKGSVVYGCSINHSSLCFPYTSENNFNDCYSIPDLGWSETDICVTNNCSNKIIPPDPIFGADQSGVSSSNDKIISNANMTNPILDVIYIAPNRIRLESGFGFSSNNGRLFKAEIGDCEN